MERLARAFCLREEGIDRLPGEGSWFVTILPWVKRWLSQHLYGLGLLISGDHDKAALFSLFLLLPGVILLSCAVGWRPRV